MCHHIFTFLINSLSTICHISRKYRKYSIHLYNKYSLSHYYVSVIVLCLGHINKQNAQEFLLSVSLYSPRSFVRGQLIITLPKNVMAFSAQIWECSPTSLYPSRKNLCSSNSVTNATASCWHMGADHFKRWYWFWCWSSGLVFIPFPWRNQVDLKERTTQLFLN